MRITGTPEVLFAPKTPGAFGGVGLASAAMDYATSTGGIGVDQYYTNIINWINTNNPDAAALASAMDQWGISSDDVANAYAFAYPENAGYNPTAADVDTSYNAGTSVNAAETATQAAQIAAQTTDTAAATAAAAAAEAAARTTEAAAVKAQQDATAAAAAAAARAAADRAAAEAQAKAAADEAAAAAAKVQAAKDQAAAAAAAAELKRVQDAQAAADQAVKQATAAQSQATKTLNITKTQTAQTAAPATGGAVPLVLAVAAAYFLGA